MLPKKQRLTRQQFTEVFKKSQTQHSEHFIFKNIPAPLLSVAVVVSKKVAKQATKRNRVRRQLYAIVRNLDQTKALYQGIFIAKKDTLLLSKETLQQEIVSLLQKAGY